MKKFLDSPFHNKRKDVLLLFQYCKQKIQIEQSPDEIDQYSAYAAIFKKEEFNVQKLRYVLSFLYQRMRSYFEHHALSQSQRNGRAFLTYLKDQKMSNLVQREINQRLKLESQVEMSDHLTFENRIWLEKEQHLLKQQEDRNHTTHLVRASKQLDWLFCLEKLRIYAPLMVHQQMTNLSIQDVFVPMIFQFLDDHYNEAPPVIKLYYHACRIFEPAKGEDSFQLFKKILSEYSVRLKADYLKECYTLGINYCIRQINRGERDFVAEVLSLYELGLAGDAFLENGFLSRFTYKNIVTAAVGLGRFQWAEQFIEDYHDSIDPRFRDDAYRYNLAILKYKQNDFDATQEILRDVEFEDLFFNLNARTMLLKIYYENGLWDALDFHLESFRLFLYRHRELGYQKKHYMNLVRFTRKLFKLSTMGKEQKEQLSRDVKQTESLAEREWLAEKIF